jgi:hypothetical protein
MHRRLHTPAASILVAWDTITADTKKQLGDALCAVDAAATTMIATAVC